MTATLLAPAATAPAATVPARPLLTRSGAAALVAGAALNTGQAVLLHALSSGKAPADKLADVDAHPVGMLVMVLGGLAGVVLLLAGFTALARGLRPHAPRAARVGGALTTVGTLGFLGMHVVMLVTYALAGHDDRAEAVAVLEHVDRAPVLLVVFAPFLLGMFGGLAAFVVALVRSRVVARWVPAVWGAFLVLDLVAAGRSPVDPHWLFLAGAVGLALSGRRGATA